jgi:hypothetical protein
MFVLRLRIGQPKTDSFDDRFLLYPFKMPPMAFTGIVTKVGCMNKTATVTVYRNVIHKITGKVSAPMVGSQNLSI